MLLKRGVVKVLMCIKFMVLHIECPLKVYVDLKKKKQPSMRNNLLR